MKNLILMILLLSGCATFSASETEFYHRFAAKPTITEQNLGNGKRRESIGNPFDVTIVVNVDCDNESIKRQPLTIKGNSTVTFDTTSDTDHNCSPTSWVVK